MKAVAIEYCSDCLEAICHKGTRSQDGREVPGQLCPLPDVPLEEDRSNELAYLSDCHAFVRALRATAKE